MTVTYMDLGTFRNEGFLQEANRQFFHPLGLALEVREIVGEKNNPQFIVGVWDYRDDPIGILFADWSDEMYDHAGNVESLRDSKAGRRETIMGSTIQPLGVVPPEALVDVDIVD